MFSIYLVLIRPDTDWLGKKKKKKKKKKKEEEEEEERSQITYLLTKTKQKQHLDLDFFVPSSPQGRILTVTKYTSRTIHVFFAWWVLAMAHWLTVYACCGYANMGSVWGIEAARLPKSVAVTWFKPLLSLGCLTSTEARKPVRDGCTVSST